ncbi:MAG: nucleotide exchange factor GrpE [Flavobacteriales bacterium]
MSERPEVGPEEHVREGIDAQEHATDPQSAAGQAGSEQAMGNDGNAQGSESETLRAELVVLRTEHEALHDKFIRLHAEFDNFRKRTSKEKLDLLNNAGAETIISILPILDDMERAIAHNAEVNDIDAVKQGFELIHQKFANILLAHGLKPMHAKGEPFDPELQEAISQLPSPDNKMKGKVLEVVENGYTLNDKVLRHAKVVVGA